MPSLKKPGILLFCPRRLLSGLQNKVQFEYHGNLVEGELQAVSLDQNPCEHPYYHHEMSHPPGKDPQLLIFHRVLKDDRIS